MTQGLKRIQEGIVISDKMDKTRVVLVTRRVQDARFKKYYNHHKKYPVHDPKNETKVGDRVLIIEARPLSRTKRWRIEKLVGRGVEQ